MYRVERFVLDSPVLSDFCQVRCDVCGLDWVVMVMGSVLLRVVRVRYGLIVLHWVRDGMYYPLWIRCCVGDLWVAGWFLEFAGRWIG